MAGAVIGGLLTAGGGIAGALLGQAKENPGDAILPGFTPDLDRSLAAARFDALGQIGFSDPNLVRQSGPLNQIINAINALPISEKIKRRGIKDITSGNIGSLLSGNANAVMSRLGLDIHDIRRARQQQEEFEAKVDQLSSQVGPIQEDTILNRLQAGRNLASIAAGASGGGDTAFQSRFRDAALRDRTRGLEEAEDQLLLRSRFGGFNPASGLERLSELRSDLFLDAELAGIQRALATAQGVSSILNPGSQIAQGAAGLSAQAQQGALGTAASQAAAANQLRQQLSVNNADSLATGVAGGFSSIGNALTARSLLNQLGGQDTGSTAPGTAASMLANRSITFGGR